jgi:hypothetical protein
MVTFAVMEGVDNVTKLLVTATIPEEVKLAKASRSVKATLFGVRSGERLDNERRESKSAFLTGEKEGGGEDGSWSSKGS